MYISAFQKSFKFSGVCYEAAIGIYMEVGRRHLYYSVYVVEFGCTLVNIAAILIYCDNRRRANSEQAVPAYYSQPQPQVIVSNAPLNPNTSPYTNPAMQPQAYAPPPVQPQGYAPPPEVLYTAPQPPCPGAYQVLPIVNPDSPRDLNDKQSPPPDYKEVARSQ